MELASNYWRMTLEEQRAWHEEQIKLHQLEIEHINACIYLKKLAETATVTLDPCLREFHGNKTNLFVFDGDSSKILRHWAIPGNHVLKAVNRGIESYKNKSVDESTPDWARQARKMAKVVDAYRESQASY